jgi:hypothetical protein
MGWLNIWTLFFLATSLMATVGCAGDTKHGTVSGRVTLDSQPLTTGAIHFEPIDGQTATAAAVITDGQFTAKVPPGEKRVLISAPKVVGKQKMYETPDSPTVDITEEMLPKRYNSQSTLTCTVALGSQEETFELTSNK